MTHDMWHVTHDTLHVTHSTQGVVNIVSNFRSLALKVFDSEYFKHLKEND